MKGQYQEDKRADITELLNLDRTINTINIYYMNLRMLEI